MTQTSAGLRRLVQSLQLGSFQSKLGAYFNCASSLEQICDHNFSGDEYADVDWDNLGFGLKPTDYMYVMKSSKEGQFEQGQLHRYGNIELSPSSGILNYGQGLFEGTKAYRKEDGGLLLFRPDQNATRMKIGAERMCMPSPSIEQFVDAVKQTAIANKRWIPPTGKGTLYIRPLLMGSGPVLGVAPAPEYTFLVYASPVGNYFKDGFAPLNLYIEDEYHRASRGGVGGVKTISNYAPVLKAINRANKRGFSDVLYLDALNKKYLEEVSSSNIFLVKGNVISTPATNGTILPGITRKSIIEIAQDLGYEVEERAIPVDDLINADEVFCTGTAVVVAPVGSITHQDKRMEYRTGGQSVSWKLYSDLVGIQMGLIKDKKGWTIEATSIDQNIRGPLEDDSAVKFEDFIEKSRNSIWFRNERN
ncbi:branched-chain-amino-acid aminotransferase 2, chloroplastic-like [Ricinus communis]|uniref:branched-chain-amino-acid aminotransferase 2, chloroplastic-like n=1 Tax=Ricinus communis TaxID=3988 RepID=UPI00201ACE83|nr:branched-chain-amino-acid aminotransferase 2, chloroplastic-like [Ricinus communis]XP_048227378.1 branched-chain-amino-acid aminotransferase 2, chloroplastic-like [Ricinus communis]